MYLQNTFFWHFHDHFFMLRIEHGIYNNKRELLTFDSYAFGIYNNEIEFSVAKVYNLFSTFNSYAFGTYNNKIECHSNSTKYLLIE